MGSEAWELERRYSVPGALDTRGLEPPASEDLHAWSIYRQNLNSDFTDSALGSAEKSPLPYGNFQLRDSTVQSILRHPRYGPKSPLANNSYTYLKFGLPRVLPPSRIRDGSSGYDSSEEGRKTSNQQHQHQHQQHYHPRHNHPHNASSHPVMRSARSDPDFRNLNPSATVSCSRDNVPSATGGSREHGIIHGRDNPRLRSVSEANLLNTGRMNNRRHSIAPIDPGYHNSAVVGHQHNHGTLGGHENYTSVTLRPATTMETPQHPHLQLRGIESRACNRSDGLPILRSITLEVGANEILAIMSTTEKEGTNIIESIAGRKSIRRGDILLNGRIVSSRALRSRVAYLSAENALSPGLTAQQTLSFYKLLRGSSTVSSLEIESILQELGLEATKHCLVDTLTTSEARRLSLACRLLQDSHILTLDRPTHGLDIFDAFFLVEYLRQWAGRGPRLVILTLHPPTYEILTMVSRVALTSGGRIMYSGLRRDMLPYFALAEFPCPPFKNPSDYYLDLVTLDDLSAEAMLESSQRIDHLAELAKARLPNLCDPGPPGNLPPSISTRNIFLQAYALLLKALIYNQPWALTKLLKKILLSASLGILLGAIFWDVANAPNNNNNNSNNSNNVYLCDRINYYYVSLAIFWWPLALLAINENFENRLNVERDIRDGLYNRFIYIVIETINNVFAWSVILLTYLAPAFAMSGFHLFPDGGFSPSSNYLTLSLIYLLLQYFVCILFAYLCKLPYVAILLSALVLGEVSLGAGITLHLENLPDWYRLISPLKWTMSLLVPRMFHADSLDKMTNCKSRQVLRQDIIVQVPCEPPNTKLLLREIAFDDLTVENQLQFELSLAIALLATIFLVFLAFLVCKYKTPKRAKSAPNKP